MDRQARTHDEVKRHYLSLPGKTLESWEKNIMQNPGRFNWVWRHRLGLPLSEEPPPAYWRKMDLQTGEISSD